MWLSWPSRSASSSSVRPRRARWATCSTSARDRPWHGPMIRGRPGVASPRAGAGARRPHRDGGGRTTAPAGGRRLPRGHRANIAIIVDMMHRDALGLARHVEREPGVAKPHGAAALARHLAAGHLAGDAALALAQHVVDRGGDRGDRFGHRACRRHRMEAVGKLLGDEAGREPARPPARMLHQRRKERNVVADAVDDEGIERVRPARRSRRRAVGAWVTSLAIIGS